ncbi:hypothetical protein PVAND_003558 [Polypedilum vanderplanki]|uniref:ubiquitinyl hydrolase 1 n=1 Tax=Polypedilum vanderplanki TaxID=319348 RepID=A0A9J6BUF3_POLVA|nr:hypothetical protein PVAND_003558 [Polypedilum vanderplanki]
MTILPILNKKSGNEEKDNVQRDKRINPDRLNYEVRRSPTSRSSKSHGRSSKREKAANGVQVQTKYHQPHASSSSSTAATSVNKKQQLPCPTNVVSCVTQQQSQLHSVSTSTAVAECSKSDNNIAGNSCVNKKINDQECNDDFLKILEEKVSGYNSGDEHLESKENHLTNDEWKSRDEKFSTLLESERGLIIKNMEEDGACLFRAISYQIYGDQDMHDIIRQQTMDYIYQNREYFEQFLTEDIHSYVKRKRQNHLHGNHIEIQAMSEMYNRPVELYCYELAPLNIYNPEQINNGYDPLRLSYQRNCHYNAILDPYKSSVGVGLGLAGYRPEDFDPAKQVKEAVQMSEQLEIEQMMVEDKMKVTDWEATNEVVVEQIARQSYLQFCKESMHKTFKKTSTITSTATTEASGSSSSSSSMCDTSSNDHQQGSSTTLNHYERQKSPSYVDNYYMQQHNNTGRRKKREKGEKRKQEEDGSTSSKRAKRSNSPQSSSSSISGESDSDKPVSAFYQSLLESSYASDGLGQLSEQEMMQKALIQSIQEVAKIGKNNTDDEYDSP